MYTLHKCSSRPGGRACLLIYHVRGAFKKFAEILNFFKNQAVYLIFSSQVKTKSNTVKALSNEFFNDQSKGFFSMMLNLSYQMKIVVSRLVQNEDAVSTQREIRAVVFFSQKEGVSSAEIVRRLRNVFESRCLNTKESRLQMDGTIF